MIGFERACKSADPGTFGDSSTKAISLHPSQALRIIDGQIDQGTSMSQEKECIFPISPESLGRIHVLTYGYEDAMVTDSTKDVALNTARSYFANLKPEELTAFKLHKDIVGREDFMMGVFQMARIFAQRDAEEATLKEYDENPYARIDKIVEVAELDALFSA